MPRYYPVSAPPVVQCTPTTDQSGYYMWQCGHYAWDAYTGWYWVPGQWIENHPSYRYQAGYWYQSSGRYYWQAGRWY